MILWSARNSARAPGDDMDTAFERSDLNKLAFWMATGAGKTLIMHINYHQFLHYCQEELDHLILITPNEVLSDQHMQEMEVSNIPHHRFLRGRFTKRCPGHRNNKVSRGQERWRCKCARVII